MPFEYGSVSLDKLKNLYSKVKEMKITFEITGVDVRLHNDRFGGQQWVVLLLIDSEEVANLRSQMGVEKNVLYCPHIAVLEKEIHH